MVPIVVLFRFIPLLAIQIMPRDVATVNRRTRKPMDVGFVNP